MVKRQLRHRRTEKRKRDEFRAESTLQKLSESGQPCVVLEPSKTQQTDINER